MSLEIEFDHGQRRALRPALVVSAAGVELAGELDGGAFEGTWLDPVTQTLMLRPACLMNAWYAEDGGIYAKLGASDFGLGAGWETRFDQCGKGPWLARADGTTGGEAVSAAAWAANRGFWVSWFGYGAGERFVQFECGWLPAGVATAGVESGVGVRFWTDGLVEVWRDGALAGTGRISGSRGSDVRAQALWQVMLLPCRERELLVYSLSGNGFSHRFEGIEVGEITPGGRFWFRVPTGAAQVQIAPLRFGEAGFAHTVQMSFAGAPEVGESPLFRIYGADGYGPGEQTATARLTTWEGADFSPDGTENRVRVRLDLASTDEGFTPFVTAVQGWFEATTTETVDAPMAVTDRVRGATLSVPDDPTRVGLDVLVAGDLEELGLSGNRPCRVRLGAATVLDGRAGFGEWTLRANAAAEAVELSVSDGWAAVEQAVAVERMPLDALSLEEALTLLLGQAGVRSEEMTVTETEFELPGALGGFGRWSLMVEPGDRIGEWVRRLLETYAADWTWGFRPRATGGPEFFALAPADLGETAAAELALRTEELEPGMVMVRDWEEAWLEPEANEVRVTGWDARARRPVQVVQMDRASQDAGALPEDRGENWLGEVRRFALVDPAIASLEAAEEACRRLFSRLSRVRKLAEFRCDLLRAEDGRVLWRGDVVRVVGRGRWRVLGFGCRFGYEGEAWQWRDGHYTVEWIGDEVTA